MKTRILCMTLMIFSGWAAAESARSLVQEGNAAYEKGKYDEALKAYEKAGQTAPDASEILFNKGVAYYQQKEYDKAMGAFEQAGMKTKDAKLEAKSQFNMGNCTFHKAESQMQEKPEEALKTLGRSVQYFQHAADLDPELNEAKQNVEVTRLAINTIQEAMKAQEEAAKKAQELKEKLEKLIKDQQQLQTLTQQTATQQAAVPPVPEPAPAPEQPPVEGETTATAIPAPVQPEPAPQPAPAEDSCKGLAEVQQTLKTDAQNISTEMAQYVPPPQPPQNITPPLRPPEPEGEETPPIAQAKDHVDQAVEYQDTAEQQLRESKAKESLSPQGGAVEELKKALDLLNTSENQDQQKQDQKQEQQQGDQKQEQQDQQESQEGEQEQPQAQQQEGEQQQQQAQSQQEGESEEQQAQQMQNEGENEGEDEGQDETAREILNEEQEHKMMLMQPRGGYKPVDKDW